ncbi:MAG: DUF4276 family protein [Parabacteroides sp.]|nr:DUF4276 family protein [Parabacteroides sp.]MDD6100535.1 DUF4276 family protein [bacterium]MDD6750029.1 DUF4276 family protein [bacterium]MDD7723775.1 DUF4276 family protein [bacterium]MDY4551645.1 DUF4276 family protein [Parabacteroides sp.]
MMQRLVVICEGPTEKEFCKDLLAPALYPYGIYVDTPLIKQSGGGIVPWNVLKRQIEGHLHEGDAFVTMLIDYYGIKETHKFPLWEESKSIIDLPFRIQNLCKAMLDDIDPHFRHRFIPYIQLHEFEGLLFSDVTKFKNYYSEDKMNYMALEEARYAFPNPEYINNNPSTAPSKRLISAIPSYNKVLDGNCIAMDIGLSTIRKECPLFNDWLAKLERL